MELIKNKIVRKRRNMGLTYGKMEKIWDRIVKKNWKKMMKTKTEKERKKKEWISKEENGKKKWNKIVKNELKPDKQNNWNITERERKN